MLIWTLFNSSTYTNLIYLATSLILLPYLWSAAYQVLLAVRGETYEHGPGRTRDLLIGLVALGVRRVAGLRGWLGVRPRRRRCSTWSAPRSTCGPARRAVRSSSPRSRRSWSAWSWRCSVAAVIGFIQGFVSV